MARVLFLEFILYICHALLPLCLNPKQLVHRPLH